MSKSDFFAEIVFPWEWGVFYCVCVCFFFVFFLLKPTGRTGNVHLLSTEKCYSPVGPVGKKKTSHPMEDSIAMVSG